MSVQETLQILGGIGVIASVIFASLQIRRNTTTMRATANHNINMSLASMYFDLSKNPDSLELALRGGEEFDSMTRLEKARVRFQLMGLMRIYENAFLQHELGILKGQDWDACLGDLLSSLDRPDAPKVWALVKNRNGARFRTFVDKKVSEQAAKVQVATEPPTEG